MNILVVDWNRGAANLNYFTAVANTRQAANNLTGFILSMQVCVCVWWEWDIARFL
jgi:phosphatidic acid-selective phospholipase A1